MNRNEPTGNRATAARGGFTLAEVLIASATGMTIVAAVLSLYIFLSGQGRSLRSQVAFNGQARILQTSFVDIVEASSCLLVDDDNLGVSLFPSETAMSASNNSTEYESEWVGYEAGATVRESKIVYRPNGKDTEPVRTLCEWVGPADDGEPMFRLVTGVSVALCAHVGDPAVGSTEPDTTGPGRQGMNVIVIGACRNLKRRF